MSKNNGGPATRGQMMITVSLNEIRAQDPCESGWKKALKSKGGKEANMDAQFPLTDILKSNDLDDTLWCLRCRPEYSNLWRKFAVWAARAAARDAAWDAAWDAAGAAARAAARDAAWDAAWDAARAAARDAAGAAAWDAARAAARDAAWAAAWAAAGDAAGDAAWTAAGDAARDAARAAQKAKLIQILTAGEWVE